MFRLNAFIDGGGEEVEEEAVLLSARKVDEFWQEKKSEELEVDDKDGFTLGPLLSLKEQLEKEKDDENLRRWKGKVAWLLRK